MAENQQLQQEAARQAQQAAEGGTSALCKHCGVALDPESSFCTSCGEKTGGEERACEYCSTRTTKEFCPHCGRRVIPVNCPQCGTASINDACEKCGAILNPALEAVFTQEVPEPATMSAEEAAKIEAEFKALEQNESPEFKAFQKKLIERQILLEERDYFNKREERIIKAFGSRPFTLKLPDPQEEAFRMKAYAGLEKTVIERNQKAIEAELEKMFPPLPPLAKIDDAELMRRRAEAEAEGQRWIGIEQQKLEQERQRLEQERQRRIEIERQRLEQERRKKMIEGVYYHMRYGGMLTANLRIDSAGAVCNYRCIVCGYAVITYEVRLDGDTVSLIGRTKRGNRCTFHEYNLVENYRGTINNSGTVLTGYWHKNGESVPITFYKR